MHTRINFVLNFNFLLLLIPFAEKPQHPKSLAGLPGGCKLTCHSLRAQIAGEVLH